MSNFTHLKLWIALASHNFKCVKVNLYLAQIFIAAELLFNYMILNRITFEPYNLNLITSTNVSTGAHNYNA